MSLTFLRRCAVLLLLLLLLPAAPALAGGSSLPLEQRLTAEQMRETGLDTLTPAQLARLNELLGEQAAQARAEVVAEVRREAPAQPNLIGLGDGPVVARVQGRVAGWEPGTEFRLDNGQVWKVLKGEMRLPTPREAPAIRVVPGVMGRWFLEVDPDLPKARVYRID